MLTAPGAHADDIRPCGVTADSGAEGGDCLALFITEGCNRIRSGAPCLHAGFIHTLRSHLKDLRVALGRHHIHSILVKDGTEGLKGTTLYLHIDASVTDVAAHLEGFRCRGDPDQLGLIVFRRPVAAIDKVAMMRVVLVVVFSANLAIVFEHLFSNAVLLSTIRGGSEYRHMHCEICYWWCRKDLNLRPSNYESDALTT